MRIAHCTFWVTMARFEVRLWNRAVDSRASLPARSLPRIQAKNPARIAAPTTSSRAISPRLLSAAMIPPTKTTRPTADRTAPTMSKGRVGSAGIGSLTLRASTTMIRMMTAWKMNATRQLSAVVIAPPISGPVAAPIPPMPLTTPNARARDLISRNKIVVRMYTGGMSRAVPTPSKMELPRIRTPRPGAEALITVPIP